jgi:hypothetical protein
MKFVATVTIGFASAVLWCALALAQHNPEPPASASTSEKSSFDQNVFDQALQRILRESTSRFQGVEGSRLENRRREYYFEPKISLPGASYCRVLKHEGTTIYTCEWENRKTVTNWYPRLVTAMERSLGPEWTKRPGSRQTDQQVLFFGNRKPTVQVIWERKAAVVHVVVLPEEASQQGIQTQLPELSDFFHP